MYGQRWKMWRYTIYALIGIGLLSVLIQKPSKIIIPLLLVGGIYLLFKHPPQWLMRFIRPSRTHHPKRFQPRNSTRQATGRTRLRVIEGKGAKRPREKRRKTGIH